MPILGLAACLASASAAAFSPALATQESVELEGLGGANPSILQQLSFADLVEQVSPAVVSIRTSREISGPSLGDIPPDIERLLPGLRDRFGGLDDGERRRATGEGSGFFINNQGHIVTNNHVVEDADEITVVLTSGDELTAELVGTDPETDLAVLKVEPSSQQRYVEFDISADLRVGDYVLAVGNPFGLGGTVTSGIVSAIGRGGGPNTTYADFIQIDASINRGNSGGPTFDLQGNVIGVNTAIISPTGVNAGIGLAIPADVASAVVGQIIDTGSVTRGFLGVSVRDPEPQIISAVGLDEQTGALVANVSPGSPAEEAGIEAGDIILELEGEEIADSTALTRRVGALPPGEKVRVKVFREGKTRNFRVELARRDPQQTASNASGEGGADSDTTERLGVSFQSLDDTVRRRLGLDEEVQGVLVSNVDRESEAAQAGIVPGMIITEADYQSVTSPRDIERAVESALQRGKENILLRVQTRQGLDFRALPISS
ncbi:MAG: Do family serine endopeptidase [Pseudomonadota bacterium]